MSKLIGLVPSAGAAKRFDYPVAKELLPVKVTFKTAVPIIRYVLDNMQYVHVDEVVIVTRPEKSDVMRFVSQTYNQSDMPISYVCQTDFESIGAPSAGLVQAIMTAYHAIKDHTVLLGFPDTKVEPITCYRQLITEYSKTNANITLGLFKTTTPEKFGMIHFNPFKVIDKPTKSTLETIQLEYMWGILVWDEAFTQHLYDCFFRGIHDLAVIINEATKTLKVTTCIIKDGTYVDIATKKDYIDTWW